MRYFLLSTNRLLLLSHRILQNYLKRELAPTFYCARILTFPPAFTITSPSPQQGEVMVKVGGKTLLSSRSRTHSLT